MKDEHELKKIPAGDALAQSTNFSTVNIAHLRELFPETFVEGKIDFDALKQALGDSVDDRDEKFGLNWYGKRRARQLALAPSAGTLRPVREESVDWDNTQNLFIEGDNLEVLKLLQKSFASKAKAIYIDPPYNTGGDFIYPDKYAESIKTYLELTGQTDAGGTWLTSNADTSGRFHTAWLNMMYPRLKLARNLLHPEGVLFISIDEGEYAHLRTIVAEMYGEENIIGTVVWKNATDNNPTNIATEHEYVLAVARGREALEREWKSTVSDIKDVLARIGRELTSKFSGAALTTEYTNWFREHKAELGPLDRYKYIDAGGVYTGSQSVHNPGREGYRYDVLHPTTKRPCKQPLMGYRFPKDTMDDLLAQGKILFGEDESKIIELKVYASEFQDKLSSVFELDGRLGPYELKEDFPDSGKVFSNPKPTRLLTTLLSFVLRKEGDLVIDFFAGSGTTARAALELSRTDSIRRRYCLVQLPEPLDPTNKDQKAAAHFCDGIKRPRTIAEVTKERLRRVAKRMLNDVPGFKGDTGFRVFRLASSNIVAWDPDRANLPKSLEESVEHLKTDRTDSDILTELLLKLGLDPCVAIETQTIAGHAVHAIGGGVLLACLADKLPREKIEPLAQGLVSWHRALRPAGDSTCVFRDNAFPDDVSKTNLAAILQQNGLMNVRSL